MDTNDIQSTTVEIILYYLTTSGISILGKSTTVEIILYYLTHNSNLTNRLQSTTVEIILYYLTMGLTVLQR